MGFRQNAGVLAACLIAFAPGCTGDVKRLDDADRESPLAAAALALQQKGDIEGAIRSYTDALAQDPKLARLHLELALLLHERERDYIGALYHYRRYLELRPDAEKRAMIEDRMRMAGQLFAASVMRQHARWGQFQTEESARRIAELELENEALKDKVISQSSDMARMAAGTEEPIEPVGGSDDVEPSPTLPVQSGGVGATPPAGVTQPRRVVRTYRVRNGDSLVSIAEAMYQDSDQWATIYKANRGTIGSPDRLKPGQVLVIP